jgi:hypothetical protein
MVQYLFICVWLFSLLYIAIPTFGPQWYPSAGQVILFQSLTVIATYFCGKNCYQLVKGIEKTAGVTRVFREISSSILALMTVFGIFLICMGAYASLTGGILIR